MSKGEEKKHLQGSNSSAGEDDDSRVIEKLIHERIESGFTKINEEIASLKYEQKDDIKFLREELIKWGYKILKQGMGRGQFATRINRILQQRLESTAEERVRLKKDFEVLKGNFGAKIRIFQKKGQTSLLQIFLLLLLSLAN